MQTSEIHCAFILVDVQPTGATRFFHIKKWFILKHTDTCNHVFSEVASLQREPMFSWLYALFRGSYAAF